MMAFCAETSEPSLTALIRSGKIRFRDVLQSGHLRVIEKTAARANVRIDKARVRRVLPPMRELVAIGIEDRIEAKGLNESSNCWAGQSRLLYFLPEKSHENRTVTIGPG